MPATNATPEHDREGAQQQPDPAGQQALEGGPDHGVAVASGRPARRSRAMVSSTCSRVGVAQLVDDPAVGEEEHPVGVRRRHRVVGDHHDRLPVLVDAARGAARAPRRPRWSRGCRWARRRRRSVGRLTSARATATRCCWPPESSFGLWSSRSARLTVAITESYHSWSGLRPAIASGSRMFSFGGQGRHQVVGLEDEADLVAAQPGQRLVLEPGQLLVADHDRPGVGGVERGQAVHQRRLAGAAGAHHRGELAGHAGRGSRRPAPPPGSHPRRRSWSGSAPAPRPRPHSWLHSGSRGKPADRG